MTGPVPLGRLVVEERVISEQGGPPVTVAPSGDGSTLVMTAGRAVAVMDLGEGEPEWRAVAVPAGLLADASGADRPEPFAWGPFVALLAPSGMLLLFDHAGEVRVTVPVPAGSKVLDAWGDRLALRSGDRERIGLYRLRSQGGAPHLEVVVPPSRGVRELFPGVGPVVHVLLGPGPEVVHLFGGVGPVAHPFRVACGRRPERLGPPVDLPFEPGGFERWLRLGGRTFAVAHAISVSLLDPARGLLAVHPSRPPLLNRPMVSFLARARPSSLKAVAVALAAADRLWQVPLPIGEEDDGRERLAALVPRGGSELWVATSRRAMRLDLPRLRRLVREVPWVDLGQVLDPGDLFDYSAAAVLSLSPGGGRWLGEILSVCGRGQPPGGVAVEARRRGLGARDVAASFSQLPQTGLATARIAAQVAVELSDDPLDQARAWLHSGEDAQVRLGLLAVAQALGWLRGDTEMQSARVTRVRYSGCGSGSGDRDLMGAQPSPRAAATLVRLAARAGAGRWPMETTLALAALASPEALPALRRLFGESQDPTHRTVAALGLLALEPGDLAAGEAVADAWPVWADWFPGPFADLERVFPSGAGVARAALPFVGGALNSSALRVVGRAWPELLAELLVHLGAVVALYAGSPGRRTVPSDAVLEAARMAMSLGLDAAAGLAGLPGALEAVVAMTLALGGEVPPLGGRPDPRRASALAEQLSGRCPSPRSRRDRPNAVMRGQYHRLLETTWGRSPRLAAPLALLWPGVPAGAGGTVPATRTRGVPSVGEALGVLAEDRGPVARLLLAGYRRAAGLAAGTEGLEALLEPGALGPFEDLRFLVLPWLPWERAEALAPTLDHRRAPCWLSWALGWFDGEAGW